MNGRQKLIRETPKLLESFQDSHYAAGFILVDLDDAPCVSTVFELFDASVRRIARLGERQNRFLSVCIAIKEIQ